MTAKDYHKSTRSVDTPMWTLAMALNFAEEYYKYKQENEPNNGFVTVFEQTPPENEELLVKAPNGIYHLISWRPAYNIFACQCKGESSLDWQWKRFK